MLNIIAIIIGVLLLVFNVWKLLSKFGQYSDVNKTLEGLNKSIDSIKTSSLPNVDRLQKAVNDVENIHKQLAEFIKSNVTTLDEGLAKRIKDFYEKEMDVIKAYSVNPMAFKYQYDAQGSFGAVLELHEQEFKVWDQMVKSFKNNLTSGDDKKDNTNLQNLITNLQNAHSVLTSEFSNVSNLTANAKTIQNVNITFPDSKLNLGLINIIGLIIIAVLTIVSFL